jgi:hypothetical protein
MSDESERGALFIIASPAHLSLTGDRESCELFLQLAHLRAGLVRQLIGQAVAAAGPPDGRLRTDERLHARLDLDADSPLEVTFAAHEATTVSWALDALLLGLGPEAVAAAAQRNLAAEPGDLGTYIVAGHA